VRSGDLDRPAREFDIDDTVSNRKGAALTAHQFQAVAKALADPRRMALLESIGSERECSCQKLCSESGITKGTVSHHMRELVRAGLIEERREGQYMFYEMRRDVLAAYVAELMRRVVPVGNA
jgi:ArsR family transcriptional regulator